MYVRSVEDRHVVYKIDEIYSTPDLVLAGWSHWFIIVNSVLLQSF